MNQETAEAEAEHWCRPRPEHRAEGGAEREEAAAEAALHGFAVAGAQAQRQPERRGTGTTTQTIPRTERRKKKLGQQRKEGLLPERTPSGSSWAQSSAQRARRVDTRLLFSPF